MMNRRFIPLIFLIATLILVVRPALAFEKVNIGFFGGVALGGYDAVSYFTTSQAVEGSQEFALEWNGASWLFVSQANRQRFTNSPEQFAPQYGGYCANQMSLGYLSDIDPEVWRIIDGKLYVFGHESGRVRWQTDTDKHISKAVRNWQTYLSQ